MLKRKTKITSLLVATAAVVSLVPASADEVKQIYSQEGTVYNAIAYKDGTFYVDGEVDGPSEGAYYLKGGEYTELENVDSGDDVVLFGDKNLDVDDGDYTVDLENGSVTEDDIVSNTSDAASIALRQAIKENTEDRYIELETGNLKDENDLAIISGAKYGAVWYATTYSKTDSDINGGAPELNVYTDVDGNYIDADYNLGSIKVTTTSSAANNAKTITIENTNDSYDSASENDAVTTSVAQEKLLGQDKDNIYRLVTITVKTDSDSSITEINGVELSDAGIFDVEDNGSTVKYKAIQKISKEQNTDDIDGAKYAATVETYAVSDEDGQELDGDSLINNYNTQFTVADSKLIAYNVENEDSIIVRAYTLNSSDEYYYLDEEDESIEACEYSDYQGAAIQTDVYGNLWRLEGGYIYEFDNINTWNKVYRVDGSFDEFSVYDKDNIFVWNEDDEVYSVIDEETETSDSSEPQESPGDTTYVDVQYGTLDGAISYKNGAALIEGEIEGNEGVYYLTDGEYTKLENIDADSQYGVYGSKYASINDGEYFVDLETGTVSDGNIQDDSKDAAAEALKNEIKDAERYGKDDVTIAALTEIPGNKFGETWDSTNDYTISDDLLGNSYDKPNIYADSKGAYIDADYNLGEIKVKTTGSGAENTVIVENTRDSYDSVHVSVKQDKILSQDADNIYRLVTVTVNTDEDYTISEINDVDISNPIFTSEDNGSIVKYKAIQKISKDASSDKIDGANYAKSATTYAVSTDKGEILDGCDLILDSDTQFTIAGSKLIAYNIEEYGYGVTVRAYNLQSSDGYYYTDEEDESTEDCEYSEDQGAAVQTDVYGNLWRLDGGYIYKFDNVDDWDKVYKVDGSFDEFSVCDENNMVVWNEEDEVYSIISGQTVAEESTGPDSEEDSIADEEIQNGTVYGAVAYKDGISYIGGEIKDNEGAYYLSEGEYTKLEDASADSQYEPYGSKYAKADNGDYFVDFETGTAIEDDIEQDDKDSVAFELRKRAKDDTDDRYDEFYTDKLKEEAELNTIPGAKYGALWYATTYRAASDSRANNSATSFNVYTDKDGNYIDADYNSGKIRVTTTDWDWGYLSETVTVENTNDTYDAADGSDAISVSVEQNKVLTQDADYIYRLATVTISVDPSLSNARISKINGLQLFGNNFEFEDDRETVSFKAIQKISKEQSLNDIDGVHYAKTVFTYALSDDDGNNLSNESLITDADTQFTVVGGKLIAYNTVNDEGSVTVNAYTLKSVNGYYYADEEGESIEDCEYNDIDGNSTAVETDVNGNLWRLNAGYIYKFDNIDDWDEVYKVDETFDRFSVYDKDNIVAWSEKNKIYSVIGGTTETSGNTDSSTNNDSGTSTGGNTGSSTNNNSDTSTGGNTGSSTNDNSNVSTGGNPGTSTSSNSSSSSGSSSGGSGGSSSGGSGGSSSSSSSSTSGASATSSASTSATGTSTGVTADSTAPVSLANMSKETVKAFEAKVVSSIGEIIGAVAGQTEEVATVDGTKVSVTPITKDGKGVGSVITAETSSAKAVIPIDKDAAPVTAVYKYVPLLDKYIQVPDVVITSDAITLPVQANATYVAYPVAMPTTEIITQGWVQTGDSWYMVNTTGDPLTGWQLDGRGWTYMSPTTGVMQTGWAQLGSTWYYLRSNGYMATGWVNDGSNWYYLKADGSMAANTTVDGYKVGSNGAWIR